MRQLLRNFLGKAQGITPIEYGLIAALLVVAAIGAVKTFSGEGADRSAPAATVQAR